MKVNNSLQKALPSNPYINDIFKRESFGNSLTRLISSIEDHAVICLDEKWGMGKTTFLDMWISDLQRKNINVITFNAFENEMFGEPFILFSSEIECLIQNNFTKENKVHSTVDKMKAVVPDLAKKILFSSVKIALKVASSGILDLNGVKNDSVTDGISNIIDETIKAETTEIENRKKVLESFKSTLLEAASYIKENQNFPLLIIIDELDRCCPDYSLKMLEQISHFFDVHNVVFLISCNLDQIKNHVSHIYGMESDSDQYLQKFFNIRLSFPRIQYDNQLTKAEQYLIKALERNNIPDILNDRISIIGLLCDFYKLSLREIDQVVALLLIYKNTFLGRNRIAYIQINAFLCIIKIKFPDLFKKIIAGSYSYANIKDELHFDDIMNSETLGSRSKFFIQTVKYHFSTEEEYDAFNKDENISRFDNQYIEYSIERSKIIQTYCEDINSFVN